MFRYHQELREHHLQDKCTECGHGRRAHRAREAGAARVQREVLEPPGQGGHGPEQRPQHARRTRTGHRLLPRLVGHQHLRGARETIYVIKQMQKNR